MVIWTTRATWLVAAILAPWGLWSEASDPVRAVAAACGWVAWSAVMVGVVVMLPVALTAVRLASPIVALLSAGALLRGTDDDLPWIVLGTVLVLVGALGAASAPSAAAMVGGGAYGREVRMPLRTPVPHLAPAALAWAAWVAGCVGGPLLVAAGATVPGVALCGLGAVLLAIVPRRLHGLSRRWLVKVPAGLVVHDHLVLDETLMVRAHEIASITIVASGGDEADLTGGVVGSRLRVDLADSTTARLAQVTTRILGAGPVLHVASFAVAPLRPKDALTLFGSGRD